MERLSKELLELDWTKFETALAGASYAGLSDLLKEHHCKKWYHHAVQDPLFTILPNTKGPFTSLIQVCNSN
ncbi:hypothetical protein L484_016855 [Morus notabilis]|uniref:Uncharacterized protein n=1 Tax=Morus notabilis TaxID=981085 RepID=W9QEQ8_9ROSA|nr:hypothetical protein L484_016855 [Morus notabilis]